jgi:hypothetical protein
MPVIRYSFLSVSQYLPDAVVAEIKAGQNYRTDPSADGQMQRKMIAILQPAN